MTSIVTILHGEKEFIPLILDNFKNFNDNESFELIIVDDGEEKSASAMKWPGKRGGRPSKEL